MSFKRSKTVKCTSAQKKKQESEMYNSINFLYWLTIHSNIKKINKSTDSERILQETTLRIRTQRKVTHCFVPTHPLFSYIFIYILMTRVYCHIFFYVTIPLGTLTTPVRMAWINQEREIEGGRPKQCVWEVQSNLPPAKFDGLDCFMVLVHFRMASIWIYLHHSIQLFNKPYLDFTSYFSPLPKNREKEERAQI